MRSPITLDALRVLDAIDRKNTFAGAAQELHRVPSAISYTVGKLEEDLGVELFNRSERKAVLTAAGRLLLDQGRNLLAANDELAQRVRAVASGWEAQLRIAIDSALGYEPLYKIIEQFQEQGHNSEIVVMEEVLGGTWEALLSKRCDLALGVEGHAPASGVDVYTLGKMQFVFAVSADHPLCSYDQPLSSSDILPFTTVVVADSARYSPSRSVGVLDGRSRLIVSGIEQKIEAQKQGLGIGYLPLHRIQHLIDKGDLRVLQLDNQRKPFVVSAAWRTGHSGKAMDWFLKKIRKARWLP